jgi:type VI secretion system protein ImpK
MDTPVNYPVTRLVEACEPIFILINKIRMSPDELGDMDVLRNQITELLKEMDSKARSVGFSGEEIKLAQYALVVFLDEVILGSLWQERDLWEEEPLQLELYGKNTGGEDFFREIEKILNADYGTSDLIEVYYLCLVLGFEGDYVDDQEKLRNTKEKLLGSLRTRPGQDNNLSPSWRPPEEALLKEKKRFGQWLIPVGSIALVVIIYVIYFFLVDSQVDEVARQISEF